MDFFATMLIGILVGIVTAAVILIGKTLFYESLLPRLIEWRATGLSLNGTWEAELDYPGADLIAHETILVVQRAGTISGTTQYVETQKSTGRVVREKQFTITGTFEDGVLCATYFDTSRTSDSRGSYCLRTRDADTLVGKTSILDLDINRIVSYDYEWSRK